MHDLHLSSDEFRRRGHAIVDWIAEYYERLESLPVRSPVRPGQVRDQLPPSPPETGESFEAVMRDLESIILPGVTHWQSPNFFAYFPANASGPGVLGELLSAGLGVQGMLWATSPACTELEMVVLDWLVEALGLPDHFRTIDSGGEARGGGVIQDTASSATLCAIVAARERERATPITDLVAYASVEAHSSVEKGIRIAGLDRTALRRVATDDRGRMRAEALRAAMDDDRAAGRRPFFVAATVGTTSTGATDPLPEIAPICREQGTWFHVDAAMFGSAAVCPEFRAMHAGLEDADSYCFNPHKWLLTNFDCDCFYVAERESLVRALTILPEYLRNRDSEGGEVIDYRDWQVPLGRRFRALKLWMVMRHYGVEGLRAHIRHHVALADEFAGWVEASDEFELVTDRELALVCFRAQRSDEFNEALLEAVNAEGAMYLSHTRVADRFTLRMALGGVRTEERHVRAAWDGLVATARRLAKK